MFWMNHLSLSLNQQISQLGPTVCYDVIKANLNSSRLASSYGLDVLDLHFHFRLSLQNRMPDGVHWNAVAHRHISTLLLQHVADAWGVKLQDSPCPPGRGQYKHTQTRMNQ